MSARMAKAVSAVTPCPTPSSQAPSGPSTTSATAHRITVPTIIDSVVAASESMPVAGVPGRSEAPAP